ncbi:hypothetical protein [Methylorubrum extorquens]|uniref:Uncharacterized protein n=1 Tax=Methylorubrum extorquens DSM 13060 TaxID=882800 RepID=H1KCL1_METEX|nr:hypothetical protein [Methylorubrum extorquens]EHP94684.1 hypothetical protein MetexDRAFT_0373 [Methylorubrum extorquens DSM 13060]
MRKGPLLLLLSMGVAGLGPPSVRAQTSGGLSLPKAQVQCILGQIDAFLDDPDDPVIIYLDLCLSTPQENASAAAGPTRLDLPTTRRPETRRGAAPPSVSLSKAVLRCLKAAAASPGYPPATDPVALPNTCP